MTRADNLRGAMLMTLSMAGFAVEDMFIKAAAHSLPVGQVMVVMGIAGILTFGLMARRMGEPAFPSGFLAPPLLIRSGFEIGGRLFYALAIALTPLSTTSAILQATPLVVIAGAAILFNERVGWLRWLAVLVGLIGVLVILRPGVAGFSALSLLAVAGMLGFAGRDLATRAAPMRLSNRQLGVIGFAMLGIAGLVILGWTGGARLPDGREAALMLGACTFGIVGYHALTAAMRTGEVAAVTPFRYTRLVFALILAVLLFGERPDAQTLIGAALVVGAGLIGLTIRR
ncbi:DMT family transporter [Pseudogemmobacter blasticus]|uniref:EamA family transporter n=1 Tax=Fuscovulum blasticum DSM 2131 TaxID=1188250 RepID=A0A2T4J715_FUSBL|nr:DMT family transporter [Fuscovulum blasticum]PTE13691.1 EamA family transporter [Fuscovulum blasticum DSM 2131]